MRFIVDAQLPKALVAFLRAKGHDTIHTRDLPLKNRTPDTEIIVISLQEQRVVVSKDTDFYDRYFQKLEPYKLLFLTTGNITNPDLLHLFEANYTSIISALEQYSVVQLTRRSIIVID